MPETFRNERGQMETTMNQEAGVPVAALQQNERLWAVGVHLAALLAAVLTSWAAGLAGALAALVVWLLVRDRHPFAAAHAKESLNFNLSMLIYAVVAGGITVALVGATLLTLGFGLLLTAPAGLVLLLAWAGIAALWLVCSVVAAVKAWEGQPYRFPLTLRLFS